VAFTLRLPEELEERLRRHCFEERVSKTLVIVTALEEWLDGPSVESAKDLGPESRVLADEEDLGIPLPRAQARLLVDPEDCEAPYHHRLGGRCPHCRFEG